jgi:hypothetical protein
MPRTDERSLPETGGAVPPWKSFRRKRIQPASERQPSVSKHRAGQAWSQPRGAAGRSASSLCWFSRRGLRLLAPTGGTANRGTDSRPSSAATSSTWCRARENWSR